MAEVDKAEGVAAAETLVVITVGCAVVMTIVEVPEIIVLVTLIEVEKVVGIKMLTLARKALD